MRKGDVVHDDLNGAGRGSRSPGAETARSTASTGSIPSHREQLGRGSRIWDWLSRAVSLAILGKSSDYHMAQFNADEKYWNAVIAGRQSIPEASATPATVIEVRK
jgi:hypothetical protein